MAKLYKVLNDNKSCSGGNFDWADYLPSGDQPGKWTPDTDPDMCASGWHGTDAKHLIDFIHGDQLFEVEVQDIEWDADGKKFTSRSMCLIRQIDTWNDKNLRLFACWCVRQIWHLLTDNRSKNAVIIAEKYAIGEATTEVLAAARDAAWAAVRDAAGEATWDAAGEATWDAARAAAWDAARAAARAAAWDAARAAAWDAAGAAAGAAAGDAAWAAAGEAAWDAAWDAQSAKLIEMLGIGEIE